jgi:two-component system cell cycle response regulator
MASALRPGDLLGRIGGEEFLLLLPQTGAAAALAIAQRLRAAVEHSPIATPRGPEVSVTISVGLASSATHGGDIGDGIALVARADQALLQSKQRGRNRVTLDRTAA